MRLSSSRRRRTRRAMVFDLRREATAHHRFPGVNSLASVCASGHVGPFKTRTAFSVGDRTGHCIDNRPDDVER